MKKVKFHEKSSQSCRLSKFLSDAGVNSRRKCDELIKSGCVSVNGNIVTTPWMQINQNDTVSVNGKIIQKQQKKYYIMLNKPRGVVCTCKDPNAEIKAIDLVKIRNARLFPVGRLDKNSEGLLFLTNDGEFANKIMHPKYKISKKYIVRTHHPIENSSIIKMLRGISDGGEIIKAEKIIQKSVNVYEFLMLEGKKREVRRLVEKTGALVKRLRRIAIGKVHLDNKLPAGRWRYLRQEEINSLMKSS